MKKSNSSITGFFIAPAAPAALLYFYGLVKGYGTGAIVGPLLLLPAAYVAAFLIGIPVHRYLDRKGIYQLPAYLVGGGCIGAGFDLAINSPSIYAYHFLPVGELWVATIYAIISAGVFWCLAVRGTAAA